MDPFATLGIPRTFTVDLAQLEKRHRDLSRALHPDKFVFGSPSERRISLGKAVEVNEAWRVVRDPVKRAEALFFLAGVPVGENKEPKADPAFLMDVMEQREALAEAKLGKDVAKLSAMRNDVEARVRARERVLAKGFDDAAELPMNGAREGLLRALGELRFFKRFLEELGVAEEELSHGAV